MKIVAFFKDDINFFIDDINELALFLEHSPLIKDVFLDLDLNRLESIIFKEKENEI